jgi:hypothetical protein
MCGVRLCPSYGLIRHEIDPDPTPKGTGRQAAVAGADVMDPRRDGTKSWGRHRGQTAGGGFGAEAEFCFNRTRRHGGDDEWAL